MQALPEGGGMVAVIASVEKLSEMLPEDVAITAINGPAATVLSGGLAVLKSVVEKLTQQGIKTKFLEVSHAFHSALMEPMLAEFHQVVATVDLALPQIELIANVTGQVASAEVTSADYWVNHIRQPVQFAASMQTLAAEHYNTFIEIGPKPILLAMGQVCVPELAAVWLPSLRPEANWQTLLTSLGQLYVAGADINWNAFNQTAAGRRVSLPTYPFQRQRYWAELPHSPTPPLSHSLHPLLGTPLHLPRTTTLHFESQISSSAPDYLQDHQVFGATVLPAAGFLEMAIAALRHSHPDQALALEAVTIHQALVLEQPKTVQVLLLPAANALYRFEILSRAAADWVLHASGQVAAATTHEIVDLAQVRSRCAEPVSVDACYRRLADQGVTYGDRFRALEKVSKGHNEVLARLSVPLPLTVEAAAYHLHPVLVDACLQSLAALFLDQPQAETYLPAGAAQVHWESRADLSSVNHRLWCHAQIQPGDGEATADMRIFLSEGTPVGVLKGLKLRPASPQRVLSTPLPFQDWLYQVDWQAQPVPTAAAAADFLPSPRAICQQVAPALAAALQQPEVVAYQQFLPELEALSLAYVEQALRALGDRPPTDDAAELAAAWNIAPQQRSLFDYLLKKIAGKAEGSKAEGRRQEAEAQSLTSPTSLPHPPISPSPHLPTSPPDHRPIPPSAELSLLKRCGENLSAVLKGEIEPLTLLFPQGDLGDLTRLYESSTGAQVMNSLVQQVVTAAIAAAPHPIRILEIGAGTGGTTAHLLPQLQTVEYVFTDVSPLFLGKAQERFQDFPFVRYELLDIERSPAEQGFAQPFDLVIAANVLHATADLRQTLAHVRELLAPGGELILLESTQPLLWLDLIFGLTEGWWKFRDRELRPDYPLLSAARWHSLLAESGFIPAVLQLESSDKADNSDKAPAALNLLQTVLVAQRDQATVPPRQSETCLMLTENSDAVSALVTPLAQQGMGCVWAEWGDRYAQLAPAHFTLNPGSADDWRSLWQALTAASTPPQKVIYLASPLAAPDAAALERAAGGLLHLVQMLAEVAPPPQLYLVTQGAAYPPVVNPAQASLWGLGRVMALEHPALRCCRVDLDPYATPAQQMSALAAELNAPSAGGAVAHRQEQRWVARLDRVSLPPTLPLPDLHGENPAVKLAIAAKGTPDNLQLQPTSRRLPASDEVEIRVDAAGLNFIDVLDTLGLLPFERDWLGVECAGEIVAVGVNVTHLAMGDRVMALAAGSFAQYVTIPAVLAVLQPQGLSHVAAATIPANFLTAYYALAAVAQVQPGERVLIHAAAGGTGMAAVQIALSRGAEVFATASPRKWQVLQQMGVRQVMNSRTLDFAAEILTATANKGVDVVFNSLSGEFIPKSLSVLKPSGRFIEIGKRDVWNAEQVAAVHPQVAYHLVDLLSLTHQAPQQIQAMLQTLRQAFETGQLQPLPRRVFPLTAAVSAFRTMQQAEHVGKVVLRLPTAELGSDGVRELGSKRVEESEIAGDTCSEDFGSQELPHHPEVLRAGSANTPSPQRPPGRLRQHPITPTPSGQAPPTPHHSITPSPTYLITGGLGGLGLLVADWLAEQGACHLVLLGRRSLTDASSETQTQVRLLEAKCVRVTVMQVDVAKRDELAAAIAALDTPLHGVIHAAGVLDDGVLQQLTWERMAAVLAPKAYGAWHLHELTQEQPLEFFVLFSSAASLLGSPGQGSHVAANTFLDALAQYRQALGRPGLSINWGAWSEVGAAAKRQADQQMQLRGVTAIAPDQGLHVFSELLARQTAAQIGVVPIRWPQFFSQGLVDAFFERFQQAAPAVRPPKADWRSRLQTLPERQRLNFLTTALQREVAQVLGRSANQLPDPRLGFFDMGMDSLMAVELKNRLDMQLGTTVSSTVIFEHPTIAALAKHLAEEVVPDSPTESKSPPDLGDSGSQQTPTTVSLLPDPPPEPETSEPESEPKSSSESPADPIAEELAALERLLNHPS